jgi:lysozyme family protein
MEVKPMYSSRFLKAFERVIYHEGGHSNNASDLGNETKYGISKRSYPHLDIKSLTLDKARQIYYCDFWIKGKFENITDEAIAIKLFEISIHTGIAQANKLIQRALRSTGKVVVEDGIIGQITLTAINEADSTDLLAALKSEVAGYYRLIAQANPSQQKFITGWLNRAYSS